MNVHRVFTSILSCHELDSGMDVVEVSFDKVLEAAKTIAGVAHRTPVMTCSAIDGIAEVVDLRPGDPTLWR